MYFEPLPVFEISNAKDELLKFGVKKDGEK